MRELAILLLAFVSGVAFSQEEINRDSIVEIKKDTIKTEVVEIITSYTPKVTDAEKIKRKPVTEFTRNVDKKKLEYKFNSIPVASTFVAKSPKMKTIDVGLRERVFSNYAILGVGNVFTPYLDVYLHQNTAFDSEYGIQLKGIYSENTIKDVLLDNTYYNTGADLFYKKEDRYFDWTVGLKAKYDMYNWYGLPTEISYNVNTRNAIKPEQTYGNYELLGQLDFDDSYFSNIKANGGFFHDKFSTTEIYAGGSVLLSFPMKDFSRKFSELKLSFSGNALKGNLKHGYKSRGEKAHQIASANFNPHIFWNIGAFNIKIGAIGTFAMNRLEKEYRFLCYPDVVVDVALKKNIAGVYFGATGGIHTNSMKSFSELNSYISPTLSVLQTNEKYNFFTGFKGVIAGSLNYNLKGSYIIQENKPMFVSQLSKSDGTSIADSEGNNFLDYEFGNSFDVIYDNSNTISVFGELEYEISDNFSIGLNSRFYNYDFEREEHPWNLPKFKSELFTKYNAENWYIGTNFYYVGSRKGISYDGTTAKPIDLKGYVDLNLNGGYHINRIFTVFVKGHNLTNSTYQRFTNYNSQGFQVIGGVIWKFDKGFWKRSRR